jgi:hypothetical protein
MQGTVVKLPALPSRPVEPLEVAFLTGNGFWHQSLLCAYSFAWHSANYPRFCFFDDGTLQEWQCQLLVEKIPDSVVYRDKEVTEQIEQQLPIARFPNLHRERRHLVLMRKLVDIFAGKAHYVIYLDSDMLFWRNPESVWELARAQRPFFMTDIETSYYGRIGKFAQIFGVAPPERVNTGLLGIPAAAVDYDKAERYCLLLDKHGTGIRHFFEQTLWALLLANMNAAALPPAEYRLIIDRELEEIYQHACAPVCLHYCWKANLDYKRVEWKRWLRHHELGSLLTAAS